MGEKGMNILIITATYPPSANGVAISTRRMARALSDLGHTVGVAGPATGIESDTRIHYVRFPTLPHIPGFPKDYPIAVPILSRLTGNTWDVVHVNHPSLYARIAITFANKHNIPVLFTHHTQYETHIGTIPILRAVSQWIYNHEVVAFVRQMDAVIAPSLWMRRSLARLDFHVPIYYVPSGGLTEDFFAHVAGKAFAGADRPIFLLAMRLSREKNIPLALKAFQLWRRKRSRGTLLVIGTGPQERQLGEYARRLGIQAHVRFLGKQKNADMPSWYRTADALLYPSLSEVAPLTVLEAMACGLPIVAVQHPAIREYVRNGKTGIITSAEAQEFSEGMTQVLAHSEDFAQLSVQEAKKYDIRRIARKLVFIYKTVIKKHLIY